MAAPSKSEVATIRSWSFIAHYKKYGNLYLQQGRVISANTPAGIKITEAELAEGLRIWLESDRGWNSFLQSKAHLSYTKHAEVTDIMARYIAHNDFVLITT